MRPPNQIIRGMKDIRTRSGAQDKVVVPYKAYMAITALEMEKVRRQIEHANLIVRLNKVNARLRTVEEEKAALLERLNKEAVEQPGQQPIKSSRPTKDSPAGAQGGVFKFQY